MPFRCAGLSGRVSFTGVSNYPKITFPKQPGVLHESRVCSFLIKMWKKVVYSSLRKIKNEDHCLMPSSNFLHHRNNRKFFYKKLLTERVHEDRIFQVKTKQPTKVIIKAPFHYKTGKHRLTLRSYRFVKIEKIPTELSQLPSKIKEVVDGLGAIVEDIPAESTSIMQPQSQRLYVTYVIDKKLFSF